MRALTNGPHFFLDRPRIFLPCHLLWRWLLPYAPEFDILVARVGDNEIAIRADGRIKDTGIMSISDFGNLLERRVRVQHKCVSGEAVGAEDLL